MRKVAVVGSNGQLGHDLIAAFSENGDLTYPLRHSDIEISNLHSVSHALEQVRPQIIVNTAAMHHVENCEREPDKAFMVNAIGSRNLAIVARDMDAALIHLSTDYVFDGSKGSPYTEADIPYPLNAYGTTKLAGEHFVRATIAKHFTVRSSGLYGESPCRAKGGLNFVDLMLKLAKERDALRVVDTEVVSPTSTAELARQIVYLSRSDSYGLYHATAEGSCSWYEFAKEIFAVAGVTVPLRVAAANEFPVKVARPKYSVLENRALKDRGLNIFKPWQQGLREYLDRRSKSHTSAA